jgi:hypothetical protein
MHRRTQTQNKCILPSLPSALQLRVSFGLLNNQPPFLSVLPFVQTMKRRIVECRSEKNVDGRGRGFIFAIE